MNALSNSLFRRMSEIRMPLCFGVDTPTRFSTETPETFGTHFQGTLFLFVFTAKRPHIYTLVMQDLIAQS